MKPGKLTKRIFNHFNKKPENISPLVYWSKKERIHKNKAEKRHLRQNHIKKKGQETNKNNVTEERKKGTVKGWKNIVKL